MSIQEPTATGRADHATRFKPGQSGNPGGMPEGARKRLQKKFLNDIIAKWEERGIEALDAVIEDRPDKFLELVAGLLPTEANVNVKTTAELSPSLERLSSTLEFLAEHVERARKSAGVVSIPEPERPILPAPVHAEKSGRGK